MEASVQMDLGDETLQTDAHLFRTQADGKTILCIEENGVRLYYYDGSIYLENGSAYRTSGLFPDYSTLGEHLLELYNATDVTYARESGEEVYSVTAYGQDAAQALSLLTPTIADSLSAVDSIDLCMHVQDGEIRSIEASGSCEAQDAGGVTQPMNVWAELTIQPDVQTPHSVPQAVTDAMAGGGYQGKLELTEDLLRVISAVSELGKRDPLAARVGLTANCGPVIFNTSLDYFRTTENGRSVSGIRAGSVELWFTGEEILTKDGKTASASEQALTKCADLLEQFDDRLGRLRAPDDQLFRREELTVFSLLHDAERGLLTDARHGCKRRNQTGFRHEKARCVRFVNVHRLKRKSAPVKLVADL